MHEITERDVRKAVKALSHDAKEIFDSLRDNGSQPHATMRAALDHDSWYGIDGESVSLCPLMSRFNHSCTPNAKVPNWLNGPNGERGISAARDIAAGEEITINYDSDLYYLTRQERIDVMTTFKCACDACKPGPHSSLSDARRRLLRGLAHLTKGMAFISDDWPRDDPIITDPMLRKAAQQDKVPVTSRFFYLVLATVLHEQEGRLDLWQERQDEAFINMTMWIFKSKENIQIAKLAMSQSTWFKKLDVAFRLSTLR